MSQGLTDTGDVLVGTLFRWNPETEDRTDHLVIYSSDEIFIGRDGNHCQYQITNPYVSNKHLRIYTIIYDEVNPSEVPPLVYAQDVSSNGTLWNGYPMKGKSFLLSDGDVLQILPEFHLRFESATYTKNHFTRVQMEEMSMFKNSYCVTDRMLGSGAYGRVQMAYQTATGQQIACKIVDLRKVKINLAAELEDIQRSRFFQSASEIPMSHRPQSIEERIAVYYREAEILSKMSHPNVISFETAIHSQDTIYIFNELVTAGDLLSFLRYKGGTLQASEAAFITRQILLAVEYLHDRDIVHRDIKPDNILMTSLEAGGRVVLTDFGCAREVTQPIERMQTIVGTSEYCAPEVNPSNKQGYSKAIDLYSLGRVTAVLLTGTTPSHQPYSSEPETMDEQECLKLELTELGITGYPKDFLQKLLTLDEKQRMNVKQALCHKWFTYLPLKDKLEELYQKSVEDWKPRPRSDPALVKFDVLVAFQNSLEQSYTLHTQPGWRLKSYRLFDTVNHTSDLSDNNTSAHGAGPKPRDVAGSLFPFSQQENLRPEQGGHRARQALIYAREHMNQVMQTTPDIRPRTPEANRGHPQFVSQVNCLEPDHPFRAPGRTSYWAVSPPDIHRRGGIYPSLAERLDDMPPYPSDDTTFFNMEALPVSTGDHHRTPSPKPFTRQRAAEIRAAEARAAENQASLGGQVYEEFFNPVTGKRKRRIYGMDEDDLW